MSSKVSAKLASQVFLNSNKQGLVHKGVESDHDIESRHVSVKKFKTILSRIQQLNDITSSIL